MASFLLESKNVRALAKAISTVSRVHKDGLIEFQRDKLRICSRTETLLIKFSFSADFFDEYTCDKKRKCYIPMKALQMPFKSLILMSDREGPLRSEITIRCTVEDEVYNQIVFKISAEPPAATLTYRLFINDMDEEKKKFLGSVNRKIGYTNVELAPHQNRKDRFLLSGLNCFAPDIDQVTIHSTQSAVKFIGSMSPSVLSAKTTSEFTLTRGEFSIFSVKEDCAITVPLRNLKMFLNFVESSKIQLSSRYIFEGMGFPAHFEYSSTLFEGIFISSTPYESLSIEDEGHLAIEDAGLDESLIDHENIVPFDEELPFNEHYQPGLDQDDEQEDEEDGYNDNQSDSSDFLDGNLEGLNPSGGFRHPNNSVYGGESIRSEMNNETPYDPEKVREILDLDRDDPDEIENVEIQYSSSDED